MLASVTGRSCVRLMNPSGVTVFGDTESHRLQRMFPITVVH
jgi:hypothetical protein